MSKLKTIFAYKLVNDTQWLWSINALKNAILDYTTHTSNLEMRMVWFNSNNQSLGFFCCFEETVVCRCSIWFGQNMMTNDI